MNRFFIYDRETRGRLEVVNYELHFYPQRGDDFGEEKIKRLGEKAVRGAIPEIENYLSIMKEYIATLDCEQEKV